MVKSFDAIFSLGSSCQVASQLRRSGLRTAAGPFDWFNFASTPGFCQVLESRFERFMLLPNLEVYSHSVNCHYVRDKASNCLSFHDFKYDPKLPPLFDYPEFRDRLERRIERFNRCLSSVQDVLLIRTVKHTEDAFRIFETIENSYSNPHLRYLFVLHSSDPDTAEIDSGHPRIRIVRMPAGSTWEGDAEAWKRCLLLFDPQLTR